MRHAYRPSPPHCGSADLVSLGYTVTGGSREVQALLKILSSRWPPDQMASLAGYDSARCGEHVATLAPADVTR